MILKLPTKKSLGSDCFLGEIYQVFKVELSAVFLKLFQKHYEKIPKTFSNGIYSCNLTLEWTPYAQLHNTPQQQ